MGGGSRNGKGREIEGRGKESEGARNRSRAGGRGGLGGSEQGECPTGAGKPAGSKARPSAARCT